MSRGTNTRRDGRINEVYERFKKAFKYDPDLTYAQIYARFNIGYDKAKELKEMVAKEKRELENPDPPEHCSDCGARTGGGRCGFCEDLRQKELGT